MPEQIIGSPDQKMLWIGAEGQIGVSGVMTANTIENMYTQTMAYNASNMVEYIGKAEADSNKSGTDWQIQKLTYDTSNMIIDIKFASGTTGFVNIWSGATINYTTYPYS